MSPQYWHVGRKIDLLSHHNGVGREESEESGQGEVYMEVFRKDASLTDVDNALAGVVRRMNDL
jgi:hypothetical protein